MHFHTTPGQVTSKRLGPNLTDKALSKKEKLPGILEFYPRAAIVLKGGAKQAE